MRAYISTLHSRHPRSSPQAQSHTMPQNVFTHTLGWCMCVCVLSIDPLCARQSIVSTTCWACIRHANKRCNSHRSIYLIKEISQLCIYDHASLQYTDIHISIWLVSYHAVHYRHTVYVLADGAVRLNGVAGSRRLCCFIAN